MKEKKEKELPDLIPPEVTINGRVYAFKDLTVGQMEEVSVLLEEARKRAREEFMREADGINAAKNITINAIDILAKLRLEKKLNNFLAAVMSPMHAERFDDFKECPYDKAEEIFSYFFIKGTFWRLVFPNFSARPRAEAGNQE